MSELNPPSTLQKILNDYRKVTHTQRDSGTLFEELMIKYFENEPKFESEYKEVLSYADWADKYAEELGLPNKKDTGIDLVATNYLGEHHAIQCKNYVPSHKMAKSDIDSFMSASGKSYFSYRIVVSTVDEWTDNATQMIDNQNPPVSMINLAELEQSSIDWDEFYQSEEIKFVEKYELRPHQQGAHNGVINGLKEADRGKLILACGTGKTFTSLRIAETMAGKGKKVLFLVPSLALLSQTLNEWTQQAKIPLKNFAVCSDSDVGKRSKGDDDRVIATRSDLDFPSTTNAKSLSNAIKALHDDEHMTVVYSTYHSINVLSDAQMSHNTGEFDLIICDEAHRTTGATFDDEDESAFVMVHSDNNIMGKKRLYMTATPRIYSEDAKSTESVQLCSMDDEKLFGKELHVINFSQAVALDLLVDYKVIVLSVEESVISRRIQSLLRNEDNHLNVDDAAKIIGCWKALAKHGLYDSDDPMRRAVAFCQVIGTDYKGKAHKVSSKLISEMFSEVVETYQAAEIKALREEDPNAVIPHSLTLKCKAEHVDGSMNASEKLAKLDWLKQDLEDDTCHILSNVRCLSEGVDVPALDAVMFLTPRQSQVDVVQSVGRVMRKSAGKKLGYVILPVVVPAGMDPADALNDNKVYKVVWQVLNALRSHDDSFDAMINKLEFNGRDTSKMEVIAVTDKVQKKTATTTGKAGQKAKGGSSIGTDNSSQQQQMAMDFEVGEIERALYAKVVKKCGNRHHWEDWANDVAKIANTHIDRIEAILENPEYEKEHKAFNAFANELRDDLNDSITDEEVVEMLAQHLITKPVFDALFEQYEFAKRNPISVAMQDLLDILESHRLDKEAKQLESFYESVKMRASGVHSAEGKQKIILELYDKFFKNAFPRITERLGIVYTPTEVVDFIIHSIENVLNDEFGASLADEGVHILDPFTGTGTFVTRLLQSGLIPKDKLPHKYKHEIHANEIVLLAYYIACINIETVYHSTILDVDTKDNSKANEVGYTPFEGICLTDTFEMYEKGDLVSDLLEDNSERRKRQKALDIRVIMGNPPYSAGQTSENDNNKNVGYPSLDLSIANSYAQNSTATLQKNLYDSYIRAIRWASDRIGDKGVIGFVTNASFVDSNSMDGLRHCLAKEFSNLYIFHLRGNQRTSGELSRKEGGKIFGSGSRAPIAISILVKNPKTDSTGKIKIHDIGDYLSQNKKLEMISEFKDLKGITESNGWQEIVPDEFNDWINQRDPNFDNYINLGDKKSSNSIAIFENYSQGVLTSRDFWCTNFSKSSLATNISSMISFYNEQRDNFKNQSSSDNLSVEDIIDTNSENISWSRALKNQLKRDDLISFNSVNIRRNNYRPYTATNFYFHRSVNEMVYQMPSIFPLPETKNRVICIIGRGEKVGFSSLVSDLVPNYHFMSSSQCFPLYLYEKIVDQASENDETFQFNLTAPDEPIDDENIITDDNGKPIYRRKDAITDEGLAHFVDYYASQMSADDSISKEDLFYYIYGLLHSEEYRERYAENLTKQLPNIPRVQQYQDFVAFSNAGRKLADLHINYENLDMYQGIKFTTKLTNLKLADGQHWAKSKIEDDKFYVTKMKHGKRANQETGKNEDDPTKIVYNSQITIERIPEEAYDYVVNGKPAIEWIIERQGVKTDKKSGIINDANDWAIETMDNPRYPLELLLRVINVSLKTQSIVRELPKLVLEKI
ncbi:DEAD/DEAH box helicase [Psychrobacter sp. ANT_H59]|uniref:DEAD/DEAH box helicase n=1 Tax=Psychrobacter sp. ANT_H59 TaxID=2597354 RepID=UPI0011EDD8F6|nr:type ISP restriction/modification enzyme [Psychrobacter sp. ANT_H59]KAA0932902.1 DEAD/DEAH box helicase [Psychrobacter sp. ANT_H59]